MPKFIDAWDLRTGKKLDYRIPDTWITDGVDPNLSATDPALAVGFDPATDTPPAATIPVPPIGEAE